MSSVVQIRYKDKKNRLFSIAKMLKLIENYSFDEFLEIPSIIEPLFVFYSTTAALAMATRVGYVNALKQLVKDKLPDYPFQKMNEFIASSKAAIEASESKNLLSELEAKRYHNHQAIIEMFDHLESIIKTNDKKTANYFLCQQRLLLAMYLFHCPLRADFGNVIIPPHSMDFETHPLKEKTNYIFIQDNELVLHLGEDKMTHKKGVFRLILHPYILHLLIDMIETFGYRKYLLTDPKNLLLPLDDGMLHKQRASQMLASVITPKGVKSYLCVNTIRSAIASWFCQSHPSTLEEKEAFANQMRSSTHMLDLYYNKIVNKHD